MTPPAIFNNEPLYAGATYDESFYFFSAPYPFHFSGGRWLKSDNSSGPDTAGSEVPESDKTLMDWTGYEAYGQVRADVDAEESLLDLSTESGGISFDGANLRIRIEAEDTTAIGEATKKAILQIEAHKPSGDIDRVLELRFVIDPESTFIPEPDP